MGKITARLEPLGGKYYGSVISIHKDGERIGSFDIWLSHGFTPSDRELVSVGLIPEEWDSDKEVDDGWGGKCGCWDADYFCDSHHETVLTLKLAELLVKSINESWLAHE